MRPKLYFLALLLALSGCCATPKPTSPRTPLRITTNAMLTQRAVLTIHGRQFTLNGYLALSETGGMRLVITQALGQTMADVLIKPDGSVHVMRLSPSLRRVWIERYVARDLRCLFGNSTEPFPGRALDATHFEVKDRTYTLELRTVETKLGAQPAVLFDEMKAEGK